MSDLLPFIVSGLATGAIYGLMATGLTLTYKTSGVFNFGYGAMATAAAYLFYFLNVGHGWNWELALAVSVLGAGPLLGWLMEVVARKLAVQRAVWKIVGTAGLMLMMEGIGAVGYGTDTISVAQFLPKGRQVFRLGGVNILYPQLWVVLIAVVIVVLLYGLFRFSYLGIAMRAVVEDPDLVGMQGVSAPRVRRTSWIIGATLAALSGVLILPFVGLNSLALTLLAVQTFGAAAVGMFSSIPLTFAGGLILGVGANLITKYTLTVTSLAGLPNSLPMIILFVVLLATPSYRLLSLTAPEVRLRREWRGQPTFRLSSATIVFGGLAMVPLLVGATKLGYFTVGLTDMILLLSLGLLVKASGQVSLCQAAFAAIGAVTFSQLAAQHGVPWILALLISAAVLAVVGAVVAIPAIRLSGVFLALATFAFGIMLAELLYPMGFMFTTIASGRPVSRPSIAHSDKSYYYLVLLFVAATALLMVAIEKGRLGRLLRGLADTPIGVTSMGLNTVTTKTIVFALSAALTGVAGVLYAGSLHYAVSGDPYFSFINSLTLLAILALAPLGMPWFALFGLISAVVPGYLTGQSVPNWLNVLFGLFAVTTSMTGGPPPMPARVREFLDRVGRTIELSSRHRPAVGADLDRTRPVPAGHPAPQTAAAPAPGRPGLEVHELGVRFGGLVAVDHFNFHAPLGQITGLIGPNGAGKTTVFNACSGLNRRVEGNISFRGRAITNKSAASRARAGLGRTFQRIELGDSLTVAENVALGSEAGIAGRHLWSQVAASRADRRITKEATERALTDCRITHLADLPAGVLSTGQRRLVELARCLAGQFDLLLLDEPSSGLDRRETDEMAAVMTEVVTARGCGILLVEHDMSLVMSICSHIYVLDYGRLIFDGDPAEVAASDNVRAAYLGNPIVAAEDNPAGSEDIRL